MEMKIKIKKNLFQKKIQLKGKINLCQKQENLNYIENKRVYLFQNFQKQLEYAYLYLK